MACLSVTVTERDAHTRLYCNVARLKGKSTFFDLFLFKLLATLYHFLVIISLLLFLGLQRDKYKTSFCFDCAVFTSL